MLRFNPLSGTLDIPSDSKALNAHTGNTSNPHSVTKAQVGLGNVDNTSDLNKPVSTAQATAIGLKANQATTYTKTEVDALDAAHVAATDPHTQYLNSDRGDARYAGKPYSVMAKSQFASLSSSYGILGRIFGNDGYKNDLQVYGLSTQASTPTPDAPVPIVSTTGNVTVDSRSKNLFAPVATTTMNGVTLTQNSNGSYTLIGTATAATEFYVYKTYATSGLNYGTQYTLGLSIASVAKIYIHSSNGALWVATQGALTAGTSTTFTLSTQNAQGFKFVIRVDSGQAINETIQPQLEVGSSKTAFEAPIVTTQTLPLSTTQLRSLPNGVSDRIYKDGSTWKLEQNVGSRVFNGTENWQDYAPARADSPTQTGFLLLLGDGTPPQTATSAISSHFVHGTAAVTPTRTTGISYNTTNNGYVYVTIPLTVLGVASNTDTALSRTKWLQLLASGNMVVNFQKATTTTTTITDPTLITALENIRTYQGVTNITASTPVSGSYGLDLTKTLAGKVDTTGDQTIVGVKTFTSAPIAPSGTSIGGVLYLTGTGFPEGVVTAPVGSIYIDKAITNGASSWIKKSGTGNTGWQVLEGDTGWRNINSLATGLTSGNIFIKRSGSSVFLNYVDAVFGTNTGTYTTLTNPTGFAPSQGCNHVILTGGSLIRLLTSTSIANLYSLTSGAVINGLATFNTINAWPTTLPGTAV